MSGNERTVSVLRVAAAGDLSGLRHAVESAARAAGVSAVNAMNLMTAVNEIAANALIHARSDGVVTISKVADGVVVEVRDSGPGLTHAVPEVLPPPAQAGGRGLIMARLLCQDLTIRSGPDGVTVRLFVATG